MSGEDHLSNEIAISAKLEDRSITASAKSRAVAAIDRLLGSLADIPSALFENIAAKARLRGELERTKLIEAHQRQDQDDIYEGSAYLQAKSEEEEVRKLENLRKVVDSSVEFLEEENLTPGVCSEQEEIDPDWLNRFRNYASEVSSETMQSIWGRVLAGEIQTPNTFSLSTLRFLSEVDQTVARVFQERSRTALNGEFIPKSVNLSGKLLAEFGLLEEADLLRDVNGFLGIDKEPDSNGMIYVRERNYILIVEVTKKQRLSLIPLTRIGKEILSILPNPDPLAGLEAAFDSMDPEKITSAKIVAVLEDFPDGRIRHADFKVLK